MVPIIARYRAGWRMSTSEAALANRTLMTLGIPTPTICVYQEYAEKVPGLNGAQKLRGFPQAQVGWQRLNRQQATILRAEIEAGLTAGYLFLTIDRATGLSTGPDWIDIKARPFMPDFSATPQTFGQAYEQLTLQLQMITVVNAPSLYA